MEGKQGGHATKKEKDQILVQICDHKPMEEEVLVLKGAIAQDERKTYL